MSYELLRNFIFCMYLEFAIVKFCLNYDFFKVILSIPNKSRLLLALDIPIATIYNPLVLKNNELFYI